MAEHEAHPPMDGDNLRHRDTAAPLRMEGGSGGDAALGHQHPPPSTTMACCRRRCRTMHPGSISNLCSATLGAGALSLPFAISLTGIVFGVLLLIASAYLTIISIDVIVEACARTQLYKYEDVSVRLVGKGAGRVLEASLLIFCFGTAVAYIVAVGDILDQGLRSIPALTEWKLMRMYSRESIMVLFWVTVMFPLSLQRNVQALERFSPLGVLSIIFLVMSAVIHEITHLSDDTDAAQSHATTDLSSMMWPGSFWDVVQAFPIFIFAFSCQVNVCAIYEELAPSLDHADATNNTDSAVKERTMGRITRNGILLCMSLYILIGLFGFLDFAEMTDDNILNNYCIKSTHDPLMTAASVFVAVAIVVAFPFNILPARVTLKLILERMRRRRRCATCFRFFESVACGNCLFKWTAGPSLQQEEGDAPSLEDSDANASSPVTTPLLEGDRFGDGPHLIPHMSLEGLPLDEKDEELYSAESSAAEHFLLTLLLSGSALIIALLVPGISVVFGLMGGTAASILSYILPGLFMRDALDEESSRRDKLLSNFFVVGGTLIGVLTTATTIYGLFSPGSASETCGSSGSESATPGVR
ncbi:hypothetical protein ACHAXT_010061 [Thalassiosira profunda]